MSEQGTFDSLLAEAEILSNLDPREAARQYKDLQARWKELGTAPAASWRRFRAIGDQIFQARDRETTHAVSEALSLIARAEDPGYWEGSRPGERARALREEFRALGHLGRETRELRGRLESAIDAAFTLNKQKFEARQAQRERRDSERDQRRAHAEREKTQRDHDYAARRQQRDDERAARQREWLQRQHERITKLTEAMRRLDEAIARKESKILELEDRKRPAADHLRHEYGLFGNKPLRRNHDQRSTESYVVGIEQRIYEIQDQLKDMRGKRQSMAESLRELERKVADARR